MPLATPSHDRAPVLGDSPLYLLATLISARRSNDRALERISRRRLEAIGVTIMFGDEPALQPAQPWGGADAR